LFDLKFRTTYTRLGT